MPAVQSRLSFETLRSQASPFVAYTNLGTPMANPIRIFKISNESDAAITVSYDGGTTDHEHIPANSFVLIDITSNKVWDCQFCLSVGVQVAIKGTGSGTVYMSTYYAT